MARRGRHRKPGPRQPNGQPRRHVGRDSGTTEALMLRQWWVGTGNPALASYPLGILLANGAITEAQHGAACEYAWLTSAVFGRHSLAAVSWEGLAHGRVVERDSEQEERRLRQTHVKLAREPRRCRATLDNLAIYERIPRWMRPVNPRAGDVADAAYFIAAVEALLRGS